VAIAVDTNGNVIVTGSSYNGANYDFLTIKYSSAGMPMWTNRYNDSPAKTGSAISVATDASGNVVVTGDSSDPVRVASHYATIQYSSTGVAQWTNLWGGGNDHVKAMAMDSSGNVVVTGSSQSGTGLD
jgi:hypothetical protein